MKAPEYLFRERLRPSIWVFLIFLALIAMFAIAVGAAYAPVQGWITFLVICVLGMVGLNICSPVITVSTRTLVAGRATIPRSYLGEVEVLDGDRMREEQRVATRFLLVRPWRTRQGVLVEVIDEKDPHPGWLLSTKKPTELAMALNHTDATD